MNPLIKQTLETPGGQEVMKYLASKLAELRDIRNIKQIGMMQSFEEAAATTRYAHDKLQEIFAELGVKDETPEAPEDFSGLDAEDK